MKRIIISPPTHPALVVGYTVLGAIVAFLAGGALSGAVIEWLGPSGLPVALLVSWLLILSPPLSFVNIVVWRIRRGRELVVTVDVGYVDAFGIPIPVPRLRVVENYTLIAVNVGGALVPLTVAAVLLALVYHGVGLEALRDAGIVTAATALATYMGSRTVPMVGIVVPAFLPPVTSALATWLVYGLGPGAMAIAYFGGVVGSLLGADVLRLARDIGRLKTPMASIGGAGVFDGVFLSGVIAAILAG